MISAVPVWEARKVAEHVAVPSGLVPWANVHGDEVPNPPVALLRPEIVKATVPAGVETVPTLVAGSTTVAVHTDP